MVRPAHPQDEGAERAGAGFTGADAHDLFEVEDEDLAVADFPGGGGLLEGFDDLVEDVGAHGGLDLDLWEEIDNVLGAIQLGVPLLTAEAFHFGDGDALDADARECFTHFVELEWLDDGGDAFRLSR